MNHLKKYFFLVLFFLIIFFGCDKGLEPIGSNQVQFGFGGKITFIGLWPDSIKRTHLIVFKDTLKSYLDFYPPNLSGVSDTIPFGSSFFNYKSFEKFLIPILEGEYKYIAVVQSSKSELSLLRSDWKVIGIYFSKIFPSQYGTLNLTANTFTDSINIICDFNNLPIQPPGGY